METSLTPVPEIVTYEGDTFSMSLPENWLVTRVDNDQLLFVGPKVGNANVGIYVTRIAGETATLRDIAAGARDAQSVKPHYRLMSDNDISTGGFEGRMRWSSWYQDEIDMMLSVREIFCDAPGHDIMVLTCCIPNNPMLNELDLASLDVMNSFRFVDLPEPVSLRAESASDVPDPNPIRSSLEFGHLSSSPRSSCPGVEVTGPP